ncbi:MAG: hypothetical protein AAF149_04970 [Bacteroidota bacterium]
MKKYGFKIITTGIISAIMATLLSSCFDDPEFADTPRIEFSNIIYKEQGGDNPFDSLILTINFEDGDGDLGLEGEENTPPYNERNYFSNKTGDFFNFGVESIEDLLILADTAVTDTLPPYLNNDEACLFWDEAPQINVIDQDGNSVPLDTITYYQLNERHNNIYIRFFTDQNNDGQIDELTEEFDWRLINDDCSFDYNGRFPVLSDDLGNPSPLEGSITQNMVQQGPFPFFLGDGLVKLKIYILDRAGNRSNVVETPEFTLSEIKAN